MAEKLTLSRYLKGGGEVKTLTSIEAAVFGIPYPLQPGWPGKYGAMAITDRMLEDLRARIAVAKESTAKSARRRLDGLGPTEMQLTAVPVRVRTVQTSPVPGFVLRQARRYRARRAASCT